MFLPLLAATALADCKVQVSGIAEAVAIDEENPDQPAMNVDWLVQKCGSGDQEHHEIVMGSDVFTMEENLDEGYILTWFQFKDLDSDFYSSMTCTV